MKILYCLQRAALRSDDESSHRAYQEDFTAERVAFRLFQARRRSRAGCCGGSMQPRLSAAMPRLAGARALASRAPAALLAQGGLLQARYAAEPSRSKKVALRVWQGNENIHACAIALH
jgi:hypothetical protein